MKLSKYILLSAALIVAACSNDEPVTLGTEGAAAQVLAQIGETESRAAGAQWGSGDQIGISGTSGSVNYSNVSYKTSGNGSFEPTNGIASGIFLYGNEMSTFSAYYPYNSVVTADNPIIDYTINDQIARSNFDFLYASGATGNQENTEVRFTEDAAFRHVMAQLVLTFTVDKTGFSNASEVLDATKITLDGLIHSGEFNTLTGVASAKGVASKLDMELCVPEKIGDNAVKYTMIFFPQNAQDVSLSADYLGAEYKSNLSLDLTAGKNFALNITMKRTGIAVGNVSISEWSTGGSASGNVTLRPNLNYQEGILMRYPTLTESALYVAKANLGAFLDSEAGLFYTWVETHGIPANSGNFLFTDEATFQLTPEELYEKGYITAPDGSGVLKPQYDPAYQVLGGDWHLPSAADWQWLIDNCSWTYGCPEGAIYFGYTVTSKTTGNSFYIPCAGSISGSVHQGFSTNGSYMGGSTGGRTHQRGLMFGDNNVIKVESLPRNVGMPVRAVCCVQE